MIVREYDLILEEDTRHNKLEIKQSFRYEQRNFNSASEVCRLMIERYNLHQKADEYVYMLSFDARMKLLGIFEIGHGIVNGCLIDSRGIFMRAVFVGAKHIIIVHNHPSGEVEPSQDDKIMNRKIGDAGKLMDISLIDNIIMGSNSFYTFKSSIETIYIIL